MFPETLLSDVPHLKSLWYTFKTGCKSEKWDEKWGFPNNVFQLPKLLFCYHVIISCRLFWHICLIKNKCHTRDPCISMWELSITCNLIWNWLCGHSPVVHVRVQIAIVKSSPRILQRANCNQVMQVHVNILSAVFFFLIVHLAINSFQWNCFPPKKLFLWNFFSFETVSMARNWDTVAERENTQLY